MLNPKLTVKLAVLTIGSLVTTGLIAQPAFSQSVRFSAAETQQAQAPSAISSDAHRAAAIQLYRSLEINLDDMRATVAKETTASAAADFKTETGRDLTERESQQMFDFWYRKFEEVFSQENVEEAIAMVYTRNFTLEELTAANQSADPLAQLTSPTLGQEIKQAVAEIADQFITDETWMNNTVQEVFEALPFMKERFES